VPETPKDSAIGIDATSVECVPMVQFRYDFELFDRAFKGCGCGPLDAAPKL
jgi:hypothetical protein